jgi:hypothetical protein
MSSTFMAAVEWSPIAEAALQARVEQGVSRMTPAQVRLWQAIRIAPEKWRQRPYGEPGGGFWVVALIGRTVIWYNDIEEGFNRSRYTSYGVIEDYWRNDDELEVTVQYLTDALQRGTDLVLMPGVPAKIFP